MTPLKPGDRVGHLTTQELETVQKPSRMWRCICDCGQIRLIAAGELHRILRCNAGAYCSRDCPYYKRRKQKPTADEMPASAPSTYCRICYDIPWRRPNKGLCHCGKPWEQEIIARPETLLGCALKDV